MKNGTLWKGKKILLSISVSHLMEDILKPEKQNEIRCSLFANEFYKLFCSRLQKRAQKHHQRH